MGREEELSGRLNAIEQALLRLLSGDVDVRIPVSDETDQTDAIALGVNVLAEEMQRRYVARTELRTWQTEISNAFIRIMNADFSPRLPVENVDSELDAINLAINSTAETLDLVFRQTKEHEDYVQSIICSMADALLVINPDDTIRMANPTACDLLGYTETELPGKSVRTLLTEEEDLSKSKCIQEIVDTGAVYGLDMTFRAKDGSAKPVNINGSTLRNAEGKVQAVVLVARDMSEIRGLIAKLTDMNHALREAMKHREKVERELRLAQKLEAVGQLAAGIAHEINTPIQYVGDSVHFLESAFEDLQTLLPSMHALIERIAVDDRVLAELRELEETADLDYLNENNPRALQRTEDGVERVSTIVRAMKEFAHPGRGEKTAANLNRAIENTVTVARNEYKYVAKVHIDLKPLPPVWCRVSELCQVFLNLIVNAAHAIEAVVKDTGQLGLIRIRSEHDDKEVKITFEDTGKGIPAEIQDRIFEPFFTTKPIGRGSGQGLALSHSIVVEGHGGRLTFETREGQGTTFIICLPVESGAPS